MITFLQTNKDIFAWSPTDMLGTSLNVITHELHINPKAKKIRQKMRHYALEQQAVIAKEVRKLFDVGFIREEKFPTWLTNVVMVKKSNRK